MKTDAWFNDAAIAASGDEDISFITNRNKYKIIVSYIQTDDTYLF